MNKPNQHIDPVNDHILSELRPAYNLSKDDIWEQMDLDSEAGSPEMKPALFKQTWFRMAASIAVFLVASVLFMAFYQKSYTCDNGKHQTLYLPDGSEVTLNAASQLSYYPFRWKLQRNLVLEGEAFFKVVKGQSFIVSSKLGNTEVIGTSFNIYSRNKYYRVFCQTGKVRVTNKQQDVELIIHPGEEAWIENNTGRVQKADAEQITAWTKNKFSFTSIPMNDVIYELELQYDVQIEYNTKDTKHLSYSGYFDKTSTVDSTLDIVCQSFGLTFVKLNKKHYKIHQSNKP